MTRLRCALGPVITAWLVCQIAPLMVAPAAFWVADQLACTCPPGADGACPMHKQTTGSPSCLIRGVDGTAVLSSLLGPAGLLPVPAPPMAPVLVGTSSPAGLSPVTVRPRSPDPPPPRS